MYEHMNEYWATINVTKKCTKFGTSKKHDY